MKATNSHAIFAAECSHTFHFHCITSNVKHGNQICPICLAKWRKIPFQNSGSCVKSSTNSNPRSNQDYSMIFQGMPPQQLHANRNVPLLFQALEPLIFDDDELVNQKTEDISSGDSDFDGGIDMKTYPEVSAVARSACFDNFGILINLKIPITKGNLIARAPIDLVTVLDISASMKGTKILLLKQAMSFVVQNLGPLDRLSVIAFSSSAHRLFPLRHMTETGKQESLQMTKHRMETNYRTLLPSAIQVKKDKACIPIHTFGFGMDHDPCAMHFISEHSGGTFSFIEAESVIQDAFAQCTGGLLSVVVQDLRVEVVCVHPVLRLRSIKAGSYKVGMDEMRRSGFIEVGDLYAGEERDFLVAVDIPVEESGNEMSLVKFRVTHKDPMRKTVVTVGGNEDVIISRPMSAPGQHMVSIEIDRQRNWLRAASAIAEAQTTAEHGNLTAAMSVLEGCRKKLVDSVSGRGGDRLCAGLVVELGQMMDRMVSRRAYESSGRAYVLSGLSSHSWQRATTRGDWMSEIQSYQTGSMVNMVNRSQTMCFSRSPSTSMVNVSPTAAPPKNRKSLRSIHSFPRP